MPFVVHPLIKENSIEVREYQQELAERVVEKGNSLVVAPTALGKTIVAVLAAAKILEKNPKAKILIVAPTKPLAVQHQKSFRKFFNLPEESIELLTGTSKPKERKDLWERAQILSATPQSIENDILSGKISLSDVKLLVFDEAHRAVKDYSYVFLAQRYLKQCPSALILALTASPGGESERIQDVCRNLFIKNVEIKSESDADVKPYVHEIEMEWRKVELPQKFLEANNLLKDFIREQFDVLKKTSYAGKIYSYQMRRTDLILLLERIRKDLLSKAQKNPTLYVAISRCAALLKVSHAELLLETQGIPALHEYFEKMKEKEKQAGASKALRFILKHEGIQKAIEIVRKLKEEGVIHPKLAELETILQEQFSQKPESRVIVFNHYRDSAKFLETHLQKFPSIKPKRFIGQAMKLRDKGMSQKEQIQAIKEFKEGKYNTLICTSVGEEGLDIPEVDLVVFFESVPSEIRAIQRRGRTGRLSKGKVILLLAKGTKDESFYWSALAKEKKMKKVLSSIKNDLSPSSQKEKKKMEQQTTLSKFSEEAKDKILIFADSREQFSEVIEELQKKEKMLLKMKQMEIGDFVLSENVIVERKTAEDFLQSMVDGRLFSQLVDLAENCQKPLLIVEGTQQQLYSLRNIHENAIKGALSVIALDYRIPILFSKDCKETALYLYLIAKREQLGKEKEIRLRFGRKGLTFEKQQQFIIESLPNVGPTLAKSLLKEFGSVKKIFNAPEDKLQKIDNIGEKKAKEIRRIIDSESKQEKHEKKEEKSRETIDSELKKEKEAKENRKEIDSESK